MDRQRSTRKTCCDACRAASSHASRTRCKHGNAQSLAAAQKGQAAAPAPQASAPHRIDIRDWPTEEGCVFEAKWPDGFRVHFVKRFSVTIFSFAPWPTLTV
jgi:hypothetical protein